MLCSHLRYLACHFVHYLPHFTLSDSIFEHEHSRELWVCKAVVCLGSNAKHFLKASQFPLWCPKTKFHSCTLALVLRSDSSLGTQKKADSHSLMPSKYHKGPCSGSQCELYPILRASLLFGCSRTRRKRSHMRTEKIPQWLPSLSVRW